MKNVTVTFFHSVAAAAGCRGCLQAHCSNMHSTSMAAEKTFCLFIYLFIRLLIKYEFMNLDKSQTGNSSAQGGAISPSPSFNSGAAEKQTKPLFCLSVLWLILFIFQNMHGHFKVTEMSPDPWPPYYWLLVILAMQDLMQPYMSLRMQDSAKWLKSKHAQYWL